MSGSDLLAHVMAADAAEARGDLPGASAHLAEAERILRQRSVTLAGVAPPSPGSAPAPTRRLTPDGRYRIKGNP